MPSTKTAPEPPDPFSAASILENADGLRYFSLSVLEKEGAKLDLMPMTVKVLLENLLRSAGTKYATDVDTPLYTKKWPESELTHEVADVQRVGRGIETGIQCRRALGQAPGERVGYLAPCAHAVADELLEITVFGHNLAPYATTLVPQPRRQSQRSSTLLPTCLQCSLQYLPHSPPLSMEQLQAALAQIEAEVEWPGGGRSLYFRDPAGNVFGVYHREES